jgi:hypothetical protein
LTTADVSEAEINRVFAGAPSRVECFKLTAPDGTWLFAMAEMPDVFSLQHNDPRTGETLWVQGKLTRVEVREVFLQFYSGTGLWRTSREWGKNPSGVVQPGGVGCQPAFLLVLGLCAALAAVIG